MTANDSQRPCRMALSPWATRRAHRSAVEGPRDKQLANEQAALRVRGVHDMVVLAAAVPELSHLLQRLETVHRVPTPAERSVSKLNHDH
jgi:hypothetical protein